jgi:histidinol dehydrogenase
VIELGLAAGIAETVAALRALAPPAADVRAVVNEILADVRARGDAAVRERTARLDKVELADDYAVPERELEAALAGLSQPVRGALELAAANIRAYHEREAASAWRLSLTQGQVVGQQVVPVGAAGLYVPGGLADYPSSVLMTAIPAQVAGCERVVVCSPPRQGGGVAPGVAAACRLLGVQAVYPVGGAQAVAAMALGTGCVPRCDVIAGPGNAYVTEAKRQLVGEVAIDGLAGPSEVVVVAESGADAEWLAADLLPQAEHGSGAMAALVDIGGALREPVTQAVDRLAAELGVDASSIAVLDCPDRPTALAFVNAFGPEHLELHTEDAEDLLADVRNAGAVFLGPFAATAFADYVAGTNHVLPTGGAARFGQGLSTIHFQKRIAVVSLDGAAARALAPAAAALAGEEGLLAHARSATLRTDQSQTLAAPDGDAAPSRQ